MFMWDDGVMSKPDLSECIQIILGDVRTRKGVRGIDIKRWCLDNCPSFAYYDILDVSDVSVEYDEVYSFWFKDKEDIVLFRLRWGA